MAQAWGTFNVGDVSFEVVDATLSGKLDDANPIEWSIDVKAEERQLEDKISCEPRAYLERFASGCRSLDEFVQTPILVDDAEAFCGGTILPGSQLCCLYVFEHDYLQHTRIELSRHSPDTARFLRIKWVGESYAFSYPLDTTPPRAKVSIDSKIQFLGFMVAADNEADAWNLLERQFEPTGFRFHQEADGPMYFLPQDRDEGPAAEPARSEPATEIERPPRGEITESAWGEIAMWAILLAAGGAYLFVSVFPKAAPEFRVITTVFASALLLTSVAVALRLRWSPELVAAVFISVMGYGTLRLIQHSSHGIGMVVGAAAALYGYFSLRRAIRPGS